MPSHVVYSNLAHFLKGVRQHFKQQSFFNKSFLVRTTKKTKMSSPLVHVHKRPGELCNAECTVVMMMMFPNTYDATTCALLSSPAHMAEAHYYTLAKRRLAAASRRKKNPVCVDMPGAQCLAKLCVCALLRTARACVLSRREAMHKRMQPWVARS